VVRFALLWWLPVGPTWDGAVYAHAADRMAEGESYTLYALDPLAPHDPTAFYPVGMAALLVPLRWLGGGHTLDPIVQILFGVALVPVVGLLGRRARGARVGRIAAWIAALWPGAILFSLSWMTEPLFTLLVTSASLVVLMQRRGHRVRGVVLAGIALGLGTYLRPVALPILLLLAGGVGLAAGSTWGARLREGARLGGMGLLAAACVIAPWSIAASLALGGPVLMSTNGGANLLIGTVGEGEFAPIPDAVDCHVEGELAADRCRAERALERIAAAPFDAVARGVLKLVHTFGHESAPAQMWARSLRTSDPEVRRTARLASLALTRSSWSLLLVAAAVGAGLLARRRFGVLQPALAAPIVGIAITHAVMLSGDRYHAPALGTMAVLAAIAIASLRAEDRTPGVSRGADRTQG
jgi:4-amino-4-deoxy-L-arabinose transferase-like glycosyltransferase